MKSLFILAFGLICCQSFGQRTFQIDKQQVDSLDYRRFKVFLALNTLEIDFIGRSVPADRRFTIDTIQAREAEQAIEQHYKDARMQQLDKQYNDRNRYSNQQAWQKSSQYYRQNKLKLEKAFLREQKKRLPRYDRYFWGYLNDRNERIVLIRFDPHRIKWYRTQGSGESHIKVLTVLVYNLDKKKLSLAGWSDEGD